METQDTPSQAQHNAAMAAQIAQMNEAFDEIACILREDTPQPLEEYHLNEIREIARTRRPQAPRPG